MRDFTIIGYSALLKVLLKKGYSFKPFHEFIVKPKEKAAILRHDVDRFPNNSLKTAQLEHELGIKGSYYFRCMPESYNEKIIKQIASLGHEIGYHYETLDNFHGNVDRAYDEFCRNLEVFRKIVPVSTICMHGSPRSHFDNRDIWKKYDYRELGIIGEPYFDIDFNKIFYLTDTGRCWDGYKFSMRDKVPMQEQWIKEGLTFHSTYDIIKAAENDRLPDQIMITVHPQRWTDSLIPWTKELIFQNIKNIYKRGLIISGRI